MFSDRYKELVAATPDIGGIGSNVQYYLDGLGNTAVQHSDAFTVVAVIAATTVAMLAAFHFAKKKPVDEAEEMRKRLELDAKYADAFGDKLFDMLCNDEIDRHEYKRACKRFGIAYRLHDLLTRKNPKRGLRFRVLHHISQIHGTVPVTARDGQPRKFGPHPSTDYPATMLVIKPDVVQRKVWLVAGKALSRRK